MLHVTGHVKVIRIEEVASLPENLSNIPVTCYNILLLGDTLKSDMCKVTRLSIHVVWVTATRSTCLIFKLVFPRIVNVSARPLQIAQNLCKCCGENTSFAILFILLLFLKILLLTVMCSAACDGDLTSNCFHDLEV